MEGGAETPRTGIFGSSAGKAAHLIAHPGFRGKRPGRIFTVPQYVVTVDTAHRPIELVVKTAANILADPEHDLVVRIETPMSDDAGRLAWLREEFRRRFAGCV